jgi:hypothetical protein
LKVIALQRLLNRKLFSYMLRCHVNPLFLSNGKENQVAAISRKFEQQKCSNYMQSMKTAEE